MLDLNSQPHSWKATAFENEQIRHMILSILFEKDYVVTRYILQSKHDKYNIPLSNPLQIHKLTIFQFHAHTFKPKRRW
jgi:hypothetical protein